MSALLFGPLGADATALLAMFGHFLVLSLLAVGGAIAVAPELHRIVVDGRGWIGDAQFSASVALAQAAPGPNVLFVAVVGFAIAGLVGAGVALAGSLIPSAALAVGVSRWGEQGPGAQTLARLKSALAPITLGLLVSTGWVLTEPTRTSAGAWAVVAATLLLMARTRLSPLWPIALGAAAGALGWV